MSLRSRSLTASMTGIHETSCRFLAQADGQNFGAAPAISDGRLPFSGT